MVELTTEQLRELGPHMVHALSWTHTNPDPRHRHQSPHGSGMTVWVDDISSPRCFLLWGWHLVQPPDIVAIADPSRIRSNIQLVGADGSRLTAAKRLLELNVAVHSLPWMGGAVSSQFGQLE